MSAAWESTAATATLRSRPRRLRVCRPPIRACRATRRSGRRARCSSRCATSLAQNKPLEWTRVHDLPDFVYFNHAIHVQKGVGCVSCHGRVDKMPMTWKEEPMTMSWCLDCHRHPERHLREKSEVLVMDLRSHLGAANQERARTRQAKPCRSRSTDQLFGVPPMKQLPELTVLDNVPPDRRLEPALGGAIAGCVEEPRRASRGRTGGGGLERPISGEGGRNR